MPEGQAIHRLATLITASFAGEPVKASSPQGRFSAGAAKINGLYAGTAQAHGKHFFMPFSPTPAGITLTNLSTYHPNETPQGVDSAKSSERGSETIWLHIHLGLYGKWSFHGEHAPNVGGAATRITRHSAMTLGEGKTVRLRLIGNMVTADLTGPHRCQVLNATEVHAILTKLGPDPIRNEPGDREYFIAAAKKRRVPIGQLVMDQSVVSGPGNIYRADCLWRVGISPHRLGVNVSRERLGKLWDDLAHTMRADVTDGIIRTIPTQYQPDPIPENDLELSRFATYHRTGRPCVRCGSTIAEADMHGRRLFWCPSCQK